MQWLPLIIFVRLKNARDNLVEVHMRNFTHSKVSFFFVMVLQLVTLPVFAQDQKAAASVEEEVAIKAPPRSITDVLRAAEGAKVDPTELAKAKELTTSSAPQTDDHLLHVNFYRQRAVAHQQLGRMDLAIEDARRAATEFKTNDARTRITSLQELGVHEQRGGNLKNAIWAYEQARAAIPNNLMGFYMSVNRHLVGAYSQAGDFEASEAALRDAEATMTILRKAQSYSENGVFWEANLDAARAINFSFQGRWIEAERSYRLSIRKSERGIESIRAEIENPRNTDPAKSKINLKNALQFKVSRQLEMANAILMQGRLVEAETQVREALEITFQTYDKNSVEVGSALSRLSRIIAEQGRSAEAVLLAKESIKSFKGGNASEESLALVNARKSLGAALVSDRKFKEADDVFTEMKIGIDKQAAGERKIPAMDLDWVIAMLKLGKYTSAEDMTQDMLSAAAKQSNVSEDRLNYLQAFNAMAIHASGKDDRAREMYRKVMPKLIDRVRNEAENQTGSTKQQERSVLILEDNISLLAKQTKTHPQIASQVAAEAYSLADLARGSSVQRALNASAARANIKDPQLALLARQEQDAQRRVGSLEDLLTGLMSAPPDQQLPAIQAKLRTDIAQLKADREKLRKQIEQKFPDYADLVNPKPSTIERTRQLLKPDEVLVSWYFAEKEGFVWAITKTGEPQFHSFPLGREKMAEMVSKLRKSLDAGVATIDDIPAFDVALSNSLYKIILEPVHTALQGKKVMLTVPHAELGQLPLALLTTKLDAQPAKAKGGDFTEYRKTAWLIKDIAVAQLPSVTALAALRNLPAPPIDRRTFVGFGDPFFSADQAKIAANTAARASNQMATRGIPLKLRSAPKTAGVSSAELALLPRLPDTKEELQEIGKALSADPSQDIFLNKDASVARVMEMDLSKRQVVMFATHGLVPGELDGLSQPALALSAPSVTGEVKGDGLLTMEKILTLKLNADWVVLSACNTASGEGAGAEAVSGLGRAFFYAGARALLVSNWPVDSEAARMLMTDMFKRQQQKQGQNKAEYLQASMVNMIDSMSSKDAKGKSKYSYAHPLFWAPFVVVGD
jgi:CHAT domain-containing protein